MVRVRPGRDGPRVISPEEEENGDTTDETDEEDPSDTTDETSLSDLVGEAEPQNFDRTFLVERNDVPTAIEEAIPIPTPWEGIPRVAMVFNLNYVWDADEQKWVRDTGNGSAAGITVEASGTLTINADEITEVSTGLTDYDNDGGVLYPVASGSGANPNEFIGFHNTDLDDATDGVAYELDWRDINQRYEVAFWNQEPSAVDVRWAVLRVSI